ncbi:MAG TPA: SRPBCC domain-containing protein [Methylobacterium sp.]
MDSDLRALWFMGRPSDIRPGGTIGPTRNHDELSDNAVLTPEKYRQYAGHSWTERVTKVEPERLLASEWDGGDNGVVTITLAAEGERTRLVLVHSGISDRAGAINFAGGWDSHLAVLERRLRGVAVPDFWALHAAAETQARAALQAD